MSYVAAYIVTRILLSLLSISHLNILSCVGARSACQVCRIIDSYTRGRLRSRTHVLKDVRYNLSANRSVLSFALAFSSSLSVTLLFVAPFCLSHSASLTNNFSSKGKAVDAAKRWRGSSRGERFNFAGFSDTST